MPLRPTKRGRTLLEEARNWDVWPLTVADLEHVAPTGAELRQWSDAEVMAYADQALAVYHAQSQGPVRCLVCDPPMMNVARG